MFFFKKKFLFPSILNSSLFLIFFFIPFFLAFFIVFKSETIKTIHVKPEDLPVTINLDEEKDKEFLSKYKRPPFIFLKKIGNGSYIAYEPYKGGLTCLKK